MMKTFQTLIKQNIQKRGEKRYKMVGPKSWQKKKTTKGGGPQKEREQVKYSNPPGAKNISDKKRRGSLERTLKLEEPSPTIIACLEIKVTCVCCNAINTFCM
jgi:hypothetical protein